MDAPVWPRHTARGLIIHESKLLLIERLRNGQHYFSIPGGGIEEGETAKETVVRELKEETGCVVTVERLLYSMRTGEADHKIYLCRYVSGDPQLPADSPEALHMTPDNQFKPVWLDLVDVPNAPFLVWQPIKERFLHDMAHGLPMQPVEIIAEPLS